MGNSNRAGQSTRDMAAKRYRNRVWYILLTMAIIVTLLWAANNGSALGIGGLGTLILFILIRIIMNAADVKARKMQKEERRAVRGAKGEEKIGSILEGLGDDYMVIHDIESPYGNIDHVVIGKSGNVFLIETKAHGGKVSVNQGKLLVNGHDPEKDFIAQTLKNTYWLRDRIQDKVKTEVWVTPLLVFTNAFVERADPIKGVTIMNKKYLLGFLQRPDKRAGNPVVWENREKVFEAALKTG